MKIFKSIILTMFVLAVTSCSLDQLEDPNNVPINGARTTLLLNSAQRNLAGLFNNASTIGMQMTRLQNSGGINYDNVFSPQSFDGIWSTAYASILLDCKNVIEFSDANGWARHAGVARVLSAYTLVLLVDFFGDVPYSQAMNGLSNLNPSVDSQASVYEQALVLLRQAEVDLKTRLTTQVPAGYLNPLAEAPQDLYYGNDYSKWIRLINSLKLKIFLNYRLTNQPLARDSITRVVADGDGLITAQNENFVFRYSTSLSDPDSRHPRFVNNYPGGGGDYMSNYLMWQMYHGYDATSTNATVGKGDPRMRFYFYRQVSTNNTDPNNIRCVTATSIPAHYAARVGSSVVYGIAGAPPGISTNAANAAWANATGTLSRTFCFPTDIGYWGRDHVDNQGIPPDGLLRTAWGVYPAGGRFDNNINQGVNATSRGGMFGAGIQPIMMRSFVRFMLAEAALTIPGVNVGGSAQAHFTAGMNNSFTDVRDWAVAGTYGIGTAAQTEANLPTGDRTDVNNLSINVFYPAATYATDVTNYVAAASAAYAAAPTGEALNYIAREYWIASFGNGVEAYNLYRRTGMPTGMQPTVQPNPGSFPRSFWYPQNFATLNNTVEQKTNLQGRIFWDNNSSNLDF